MIGPVGDYRDVYVAACGSEFPSWREGRSHEQTCPLCVGELGERDEECAADDRGICYERDYDE